jgi:hypothetical protein
VRSVVPFAALLLLLSSVATFGDVSFFMYVEGTSDQGMDIAPGGTARLAIMLNAAGGEDVSGVSYDVQLPLEGWTLQSREYSDFGWFEGDGLWDGSEPLAGNTPAVINNATYDGPAADTADFWFNSVRNPYGSTVTGWQACEVFELTVPSGTVLDLYRLTIGNTHAYDIAGTELASSGQYFDMNVTPEPVSSLLFIAGIGVLALRRRRTA